MNLELLDPFRRQLPDRVDATLTLPASLLLTLHKDVVAAPIRESDDASHASRSIEETSAAATAAEGGGDQQEEWTAAYTVAFNRRGTYLAVGHGSGAIAVHDCLSHTLSAIYPPEAKIDAFSSFETPKEQEEEKTEQQQDDAAGAAAAPSSTSAYPNGVTSVTWSRRSRTLLAGAVGDARVRLVDTTHPSGPEEIAPLLFSEMDGSDHHRSSSPYPTPVTKFAPESPGCEYVKQTRYLETRDMSVVVGNKSTAKPPAEQQTENEPFALPRRYPILSFSFSHPVGGSLQIHPRDVTAGLAVMDNGSLLLFRAPPSAWVATSEHEEMTPAVVKTFVVWNGEKELHPVTCAAFDPHGDKMYAATKDGVLLGFKVKMLLEQLASTRAKPRPIIPSFEITIPGGATVWHLIMSRNGHNLLLNCADGALRLYNAEDCWKKKQLQHSSSSSSGENAIKPKVFQDVVSKIPFASCDFSGEGEYIVGGCNNEDKYELYLWNATTGALMDRLTGAQVTLYCVAWHPTRSFLAVATSDGIVDLWGPRMDWTAFAPDFQTLHMNVEYIEREDEFDIVEKEEEEKEKEEDVDVDVVKIDPVPVFASDSESESEVFTFETKISNIMVRGRNANASGSTGRAAADELL